MNNENIFSEQVNRCIRYILYVDAKKIPIQKTTLKSKLFPEVDNELLTKIINEARKVLSDIYGYKLLSLKNTSSYILLLNEPNNDKRPLPACIDAQERRLLIAALTHIFMKQTPVKTDDMKSFLERTGLTGEIDAMNLLMRFKKQKYIKYTNVDTLEEKWLHWGERAHSEIPKMLLLEKVAKAVGQKPEYFVMQYNQAKNIPIKYNDE